jgi:hypothetical protein
MRMAEAAALGSARAASNLGDYWEGVYGLLQDRPCAKRWYAMVARAKVDDLPDHWDRESCLEEAASRAGRAERYRGPRMMNSRTVLGR